MNKYLCALSVALVCIAFEAAAQTGGSGQDRTPPSSPPSPTQDPIPPNTPPPRPTETPRPPNPASGAPRADFGQLDSNGDGSLSSDEFNKARMEGVQIAQLDRNKDGRISRDEWAQYDSTQPSQRR